jgi:PAS domain S-box-containing protein
MDRRTVDILESITDEFVAFDREWRYTYINERALDIIRRAKGEELTREDLVGKSIWEIYPEAVGSVFYQKYHEAMREQKSVEFEAYSPWSDRWGEVHAYPSEEGLFVYAHDITQRKRAEEQLRYYASLLENISDAVIATDEHFAVTAWNNGAQQMYGWSDDEVLGRNVWEAVPDDLSEEQRAEALSELSQRGRLRTDAITYDKDGMPVYVEGITIALAGGEQRERQITGYLDIRRDISERKLAEERLKESREAERSRIARDLHDEPLQDLTDALVQLQQIYAVSKDPQQTQRLMRLLATLDRIGPQLRGAIYDLRLDAEHEKIFPELLEALVLLHRQMAPQSNIAYEVHDGVLSGPLGERGRQLLRIVGEALTNVRRHSGAQNVGVGVGISEGKLWTEVRDDGGGFDATSYSEEVLSTSRGGIGIRGMRERARALGGELRIESDQESGTRVRFEMSLEKDHAEDSEEEQEVGVRVMLIEDHTAIREALASTFQAEGFEVVAQAASLSEARGMLEGIDVAVVDLGLPDGYGGDLIKALREANPQAQALVLSATLDRRETARAVEAGAAGVLSKTTHLEQVVDAVRRLRAGESLMSLEEVVKLLRFASSRREEEYEAHQAIEKLTPREIEVLQALALGLDSEGIAQRLQIALRTERNHIASILAKLGVHSQLQALVFALRHGIVEIP